MGFRQEKSERKAWKKWLEKYQDHLIESCGIPLCVLENSWTWGYFLDHGEYSSVPGSGYYDIIIEDLSEEQMMSLCVFFENEIKFNSSVSNLLNRLQFLLKRGKWAE